MIRLCIAGMALFVLIPRVGDAGEKISVAVTGSYTTDTRFIYNPDQLSTFINDRYFAYNFGFGADVRCLAHGDDIFVGVNVERIKKLEDKAGDFVSGQGVHYLLPIEEGYVVYPVELSGYFVIPVSSEDVRIYLGGGIGWYFGERIESLAGAQRALLNSPSGFGIHVLTGADIKISPLLAVRGELKFRDPQFNSVNKFQASNVWYNGVTFHLDQSQQTTLVNLNGITYGLGLVFYL